MTKHRRMIKLGGSLLEFDRMVPQFRAWLALQPPMPSVMLVGGGRWADAVRDAYAMHPLGEEAAHWLCIRLLGITAELVSRLMPEATLVRNFGELPAAIDTNQVVIVEPEQILRHEAALLEGFPAEPLPHSWDVTSDSIAARLALLMDACEVVLLKSSLPESRLTLQQAADTGYVDGYFPTAAAELQEIRCVNLRADGFPEILLRR
jgi:5-(aminomethyl)-3-furanmethanol phosphate kinase